MSSRYQETFQVVEECRLRSLQRRGVVEHLLSAVQEDDIDLKRLCAQKLPYFFSQYPKLQYPISNAIYELCEHSSSDVRMDAYQAILRISKFAPVSVKNNVDVLVQLLQTEEREELAKIQDILREHIKLFTGALLVVVELCQKPDLVQSPTNNISGANAEQDPVKPFALRFLQNDQTISVLRHVLINDPSLNCFWDDMCKLYLQSSESNRLLTLGVMAKLPCPKSHINTAAQFMGALMVDLVKVFSRYDARPAWERLETLLTWFTRAAHVSTSLKLPWYPTDLATCSDSVLHLLVSEILTEKNLGGLGQDCTLQFAILSCSIASGAAMLDAVQMSDVKRMDILAQPLFVTTARTAAVVEIRKVLSDPFVAQILTQSLLVALGNQDIKSYRNHQSFWLSLGGLANVLSEKINSDRTAFLSDKIVARLTKVSGFLSRQPPSRSSEDMVAQAKYNALHEINNTLHAHWSAYALSQTGSLQHDKCEISKQRPAQSTNRRWTKDDGRRIPDYGTRTPAPIRCVRQRIHDRIGPSQYQHQGFRKPRTKLFSRPGNTSRGF